MWEYFQNEMYMASERTQFNYYLKICQDNRSTM